MTDHERQRDDFEQVFQALLPRARLVALRVLGDEHEAEDAAAEAFARAHASWNRVGRLSHRDAWILRVASNIAIDMVRKRRSLRAEERFVDHEDASILRLEVVNALAALPRRQREVVTLRFLEGYSESATAEVLRVSPGTVKKAAHRALAALRVALGSGVEQAIGLTERGECSAPL